MIDLKNAIRTIFPKISKNTKRIDRKISVAQSSTPSDHKEFMSPPLVAGNVDSLLGGNKIFDQFSASRLGAQLYFTDPDICDAIRKNVLKATQANSDKRPFEISIDSESVTESDSIYDVLHNVFLSKNVDVYNRAKQFAKNLLIEGQVFYRVRVEKDRIVALEKIRGPRSGFKIAGPIVDEAGKGWFVQIEAATGKIVNLFMEWEVIPFVWDYDDEIGVGIPLTVAIATAHDRENKGADMLKVARHSRSWPKKVFEYDGMTPEAFQAAVATYEKSHRDIPLENEAFTDDHTQARAKVLDLSSASLYQIDDIKYHKNAKMRGMLLPRAFYSAEEAPYPARAVLDVYYDEWISSTVSAIEESLTGNFENLGIKKIINIQLILMGKVHWNTPVTLKWAEKGKFYQDENDAIEKSFENRLLSASTYLTLKHNIDFESELEQIKKDQVRMKDILGNDDIFPARKQALVSKADDSEASPVAIDDGTENEDDSQK